METLSESTFYWNINIQINLLTFNPFSGRNYTLQRFFTRANKPIQVQLILVSMAWSQKKYYYFPLNGMLKSISRLPPVFHQAFLTINHHLFILLGKERYCESELFCPGSQHNDPARFWMRTSTTGVQCTNHLLIKMIPQKRKLIKKMLVNFP